MREENESIYIESKVKQGDLWMMIKSVKCWNDKHKRFMIVEKGEIIEIRYFSPVNFRCIDELYFQLPEETFLNYVTFVGKVKEDIKFNNKHSLKSILEEDLFISINRSYNKNICKKKK